MTKSVGVHEAKTQLSRLIAHLVSGDEIVITRRGEEVARLVPPRERRRQLGRDQGVFTVPDDFDSPLSEDILRSFES